MRNIVSQFFNVFGVPCFGFSVVQCLLFSRVLILLVFNVFGFHVFGFQIFNVLGLTVFWVFNMSMCSVFNVLVCCLAWNLVSPWIIMSNPRGRRWKYKPIGVCGVRLLFLIVMYLPACSLGVTL